MQQTFKNINLHYNDLLNYNDSEINLLAKYFKLPHGSPGDQRWMIAIHLAMNHKKGKMNPPLHPNSICSNQIDIITLDTWGEDGIEPDFNIKFIDPRNPDITPQIVCFSSAGFKQYINQDTNDYRGWYQNPNASIEMTDTGLGGRASKVDQYFQLPNGMYVANTKSELMNIANSINNKQFIAYLLYPQKRIGRFDATPSTISALHGQAPGEPIYFIIERARLEKRDLIDLWKYLAEIKGIIYPINGRILTAILPENSASLDIINKINEISGIIPVIDAISDKLDRVIEYLKNNRDASILFSRDDGYNWRYERVFFNRRTMIQKYEELREQNLMWHSTNKPSSVTNYTNYNFQQSEMSLTDKTLLVMFQENVNDWIRILGIQSQLSQPSQAPAQAPPPPPPPAPAVQPTTPEQPDAPVSVGGALNFNDEDGSEDGSEDSEEEGSGLFSLVMSPHT